RPRPKPSSHRPPQRPAHSPVRPPVQRAVQEAVQKPVQTQKIPTQPTQPNQPPPHQHLSPTIPPRPQPRPKPPKPWPSNSPNLSATPSDLDPTRTLHNPFPPFARKSPT